MPIIDLQRRVREIGRLRIGQKVATSNGKSRPAKLDTFRFTSRDRQAIEAAAETWGGTVEQWADAPDGPQWQVISETAEVPVVIPPSDMAFSQWLELWSAGGCQRRCDGQHEYLSESPCKCDPDARECSMHTRLSVMLPDLPGFGLWRLDTSGYYAAAELAGLVELCKRYSVQGTLLPARLRLEQRTVKRPKPGGGGVETRRFAVPVLDVDVHPLALTGGLDPATGELSGGARAALPAGNLTPVPPVVDGAGAPSIAEQMARIDEPEPRAARSNAARPIPATGVRPRTAREAADGAPTPAEPTMPVTPAAPAGDLDVEWFAAKIPQRLRSKALIAAREAAPGLGLALPAAFADITDPRLAAAVLAHLGLDDEPPPGGGGGSPDVDAPGPGEEGEGVDEARAEPTSTPDPDRDREPVGATYGVRDVARYSNEVFRGAYDAAPHGTKTKVVDRLRHALVFTQSGGRCISLNDLTLDELVSVHSRLRDIAEGRITYRHDLEEVVFTLAATGEVVRIAVADLEVKDPAA